MSSDKDDVKPTIESPADENDKSRAAGAKVAAPTETEKKEPPKIKGEVKGEPPAIGAKAGKTESAKDEDPRVESNKNSSYAGAKSSIL